MCSCSTDGLVVLLQAVAQLGHSEHRKALSAWLVWLTCHEQDHVIGGIITGLTHYLHSWMWGAHLTQHLHINNYATMPSPVGIAMESHASQLGSFQLWM